MTGISRIGKYFPQANSLWYREYFPQANSLWYKEYFPQANSLWYKKCFTQETNRLWYKGCLPQTNSISYRAALLFITHQKLYTPKPHNQYGFFNAIYSIQAVTTRLPTPYPLFRGRCVLLLSLIEFHSSDGVLLCRLRL